MGRDVFGKGPSKRPRLPARAKLALGLGTGIALLAAVSGAAAGLFPIGRETTTSGGDVRTSLVLNPETALTPWSDCAQGVSKITTLSFDMVRSGPHPSESVIGVIQRGDLVSTRGRNAAGWWEVYRPGTCTETAWVSPDAFQTIRLDLSQQPAPPPVATPTPTPAPSSPPPDNGGGVSGSGTLIISSSLTVKLITVMGASGLGVVNDEGTRFTVAVETNAGSAFQVRLAVKNASNQPLIGQLDLTLPPGVSVSASKADGVTGLGQVGAGSWKFTMNASHDNATPDINLNFSIASDAPPGFGTIRGSMRQAAY